MERVVVRAFVEDVAYHPEGSNGKANYTNVLHEAVNVGTSHAGSFAFEPPEPWDGDDMSVVLIVDWESRDAANSSTSIPAPGVATLLCMLAAPTCDGRSCPKLSLVGSSEVVLEYGSYWEDPGAKCVGNHNLLNQIL